MKSALGSDLFLSIAERPDGDTAYPTSRLQKGLVLSQGTVDLAEEAVGFGLPVLNRGIHTLFPGTVELQSVRDGPNWAFSADYCLDRVERIARRDNASVRSTLFYAIKNSLSALMIHFAPARRPLMALSSAWRRSFGWETTYEKTSFAAHIRMTYRFDRATGTLNVEADPARLPEGQFTELIVMNEQGAHYFDVYHDSSGVRLSGSDVGCWDAVHAGEATFASSNRRVAFTVPQVPGARLYRGRELVGSWLAWSGFGYSMSPTINAFRHTIRIEALA